MNEKVNESIFTMGMRFGLAQLQNPARNLAAKTGGSPLLSKAT